MSIVQPVPGTIAVLTMTRGRHDHLLGQVDGLTVGTTPPHLHVVISMGDRDLTRGRLPLGTDRWRTIVKPVPTDRRALPYAAARNLAASLAVEEGADVLVFLDAAVIPGPRTLERYADAVAKGVGARASVDGLDGVDGPLIWTGAVLDLPEQEDPALGYPLRKLHELARRHPGAPRLAPGQTQVEPRRHLFSPASFAMTATDFEAVGGFHDGYTGPGLEAADFAASVAERGGAIVWVGGADAYRQPGERPSPDQEVKYALSHAEVWRERWGSEPGDPWLTRLVGEGHLRQDPHGRVSATARR